MTHRVVALHLSLSIAASAAAAEPPALTRPGPVKHVTVFKEKGRFGGWPANHGIWSWGNEILVGFEAGHLEPKEQGHAIDYARPAVHALARSLDGGETWTIETPPGLRPPPGQRVARVPTGTDGKPTVPFVGTMDFANPDFALTARMLDIHVGPSRFYYTQDRGRTWQGPFAIPDFGHKGIAARTDYLVEGPHELTMFLTAAKESDGKQGRVICVRTKDGGRTWKLVSLLGPEPPAGDKAIMPSSVRMDARTILTAVRRKGSIDLYRSEDNGGTWSFAGKPVPDTGANNGNPPCLTRLKDGRLALTYGYRSAPYGIRARLSTDAGRSWGQEITLRQDGGAWDLGYARTVQRPDGLLVTVYYFNDGPDEERSIAATIWDPGPSAAAEPEPVPASRRFEAPEARQGVAVGERHFYVIGNRVIAKYDRQDGRRLAVWEGPEGGPISHLNGGVVVDGRLYCAHSNYPGIPMTSSVEIWDADTLEHVGSHSFGVAGGSLTWVDYHGGFWWAGFAQYSGARAGEPGRDTSWTEVVQLDERWQRLQGWVFPPEVLDRFRPMSNSGASWGPDGLLYCTGHDHHEVYAMRLPKLASTLDLVRVVPVASFGQGIAWDRTPGAGRDLWGIVKDQRAVAVTRVAPVSQPSGSR